MCVKVCLCVPALVLASCKKQPLCVAVERWKVPGIAMSTVKFEVLDTS